MLTINDICSACGSYGQVAAIATIGGDRQIALCGTCANRRDAVREFVAQFDRARQDAAPAPLGSHIPGGGAPTA